MQNQKRKKRLNHIHGTDNIWFTFEISKLNNFGLVNFFNIKIIFRDDWLINKMTHSDSIFWLLDPYEKWSYRVDPTFVTALTCVAEAYY